MLADQDIKSTAGLIAQLEDIGDVPAYLNNARYRLGVNVGETAPEWNQDFNSVWILNKEYGVSSSGVETTLFSGVSAGATSARLVDASSYKVGHDMMIPGAGNGGIDGTEHLVTITNIDSGTETVSWDAGNPTLFTVSAGITVYHDDNLGWDAAIASGNPLWGGGLNVIHREVDFNVIGQVVAPWSLGVGGGGGIAFNPRHLTANVIRVSANAVNLNSFAVNHRHGLPTAGADFILGKTGSEFVNSTRLTRCSSVRGYKGILFQQGYSWTLNDISIALPVKYGIDVNSPIPYGAHRVTQLRIAEDTPSGTADSAIHVSAADWIQWHHIDIARFATGIHLEADVGAVSGQRFHGMYFDDGRGTAIKIAGGGNGVVDTSIVNLQLYNNDASANGIQVLDGAVNTVIDDISVIGSAGFGIEDGGSDTSINNFKCRNAGWSMNTADGLSLTSTSTGCMVSNSTFGYNRYGLAITSGATDFNIQGNNFKNNNTAATNMPSNIRASGIIKDNNGILDYLTSIASAPDFVGQEALVGGVWSKGNASGGWVTIG